MANLLRSCARANRFRVPRKMMGSKTMCYYSPVYQWQDEDVEELEQYSPGGYHPVRIGDEYCQSRYRILHKLGYSWFSTVWLARDSLAGRYVSLKINTAEASEHSSEWCVLEGLRRQSLVHPGSRFISFPLNKFWISGPNGNHLCLVNNFLGPTLHLIRNEYDNILPIKIARKVTVQLALGLACIHSHGIVHGNVQLNNIAFKLRNLDSWLVHELYGKLELPYKHKVHREDGRPLGPEAPPYTVSEPPLIGFGKPPNTDISIFDFDRASPATDLCQPSFAPLINRAPEVLLNVAAGQPADIWAFGCTVFALFSNARIFETGMENESDQLSEIVEELGRLPQHLWEKWEWRWERYEEDGTKKSGSAWSVYEERGPLATQIEQMRSSIADGPEQLSEEDRAGLLQLLEACFKYETWERITANQILELDWIKKLRADYKMEKVPAVNDTLAVYDNRKGV